MPARAVWSPVPVTSTRSDPVPFTVPRDHLFTPDASEPPRFAVIIYSFTSLVASRTMPSAGAIAAVNEHKMSPSRSRGPRVLGHCDDAHLCLAAEVASSFSAPGPGLERI